MNADKIQRRVLTEILSTNAHVEYLQQHDLHGFTDASTFKNLIPIVSYQQLRPYIDRIASGDTSPILCAHPVTECRISSGMSEGEQKLLPMLEQESTRRASLLNCVKSRIKQLFPGLYNGKEMFFNFVGAESVTKAGIIARSASIGLIKSSYYNNNESGSSYTSPNDVIRCIDAYQSLYCHLLCLLLQNQEVVQVGALFATTLIYVFSFLENYWAVLANDIRTGTLNTKIRDPLVRESVKMTRHQIS